MPGIPDPIPATDAAKKRAAERLAPYFETLPFLDQALPTIPPYWEYFGCANSADVGGIFTYDVNQSSESIQQEFEQYLKRYQIETDGWQPAGGESFLVLSSTHVPARVQPRALLLRASIFDFDSEAAPKDYQPHRRIWVEVILIENLIHARIAANRVDTLIETCPDRQWWQAINNP